MNTADVVDIITPYCDLAGLAIAEPGQAGVNPPCVTLAPVELFVTGTAGVGVRLSLDLVVERPAAGQHFDQLLVDATELLRVVTGAPNALPFADRHPFRGRPGAIGFLLRFDIPGPDLCSARDNWLYDGTRNLINIEPQLTNDEATP